MPNHIHLLLNQLVDNGISKFIQKVGGGYANYFNQKYEKKGHLFNQFKAIHIKDDSQLRHVVTYIHCNLISLLESNWKEKGIKNAQKVINFLENKYRWSSFWDYIDKPNFSSIIKKDFLLEIIGKDILKEDLRRWIRHKRELNKTISKYDNLFLE